METLSTEHLKKLNLKRVYTGSYNYFYKGTNYCEEYFEVLKSKEKSSFQFNSEMISRTKKGEIFQATVNFTVNHNFVPVLVQIQKQLGQENCKEVYKLNEITNSLEYRFYNRGVMERREIKVPAKYHIAAPTTSQSMLFIQSKNFETLSKQGYKLIQNDNSWVFKNAPYDSNMIVEKMSNSRKTIVLNGHKVKASPFTLYSENQNDPENNINEKLIVHVSKYHSIPYLIEDQVNDHRIEIVKLKNLVADET